MIAMAKRVAGERSQSQAVAYVVVLVFALCFVGVLLVNSVSWTPAKLWPWSPPTLCRNTQQGPERVADQNGTQRLKGAREVGHDR